MTETLPDTNYPVHVVERRDGYELHVRELHLSVRASDLQRGYDELMKRKQDVIEWARLLGALDQLPQPRSTETF